MRMDYELIRSKRKTLALYVRGGGVEVRAPLRLPQAEIDRFVAQKRGWIEKRLAESAAAQEQKATFAIGYGSLLPYCGKGWPVRGVPGRKAYFDGAFCLPAHLGPEEIKRVCARLYRLLAQRDLSEKARAYAAQMGVEPSAVKINGAKTRWGSCSSQKSLNFSWRLMMADEGAIDYVVVHELAHIKEMNHSKRFWALVEAVLPDYRQRRKRLKELQKRLSTEDWD